MAESRVEWMTGIVANANERGIKLQGDDEYHNWSQYGTPAAAQRPVPAKGTKIKLGLDDKGFIRDVKDKDGNPLAAGGSSSGGSTWTLADTRRVTLCSTLRAAVELMQVTGPPMVDGQAAPKQAPAVAMKIAKAWATDIMKWADQAQPAPAAPTNGHDQD